MFLSPLLKAADIQSNSSRPSICWSQILSSVSAILSKQWNFSLILASDFNKGKCYITVTQINDDN